MNVTIADPQMYELYIVNICNVSKAQFASHTMSDGIIWKKKAHIQHPNAGYFEDRYNMNENPRHLKK